MTQPPPETDETTGQSSGPGANVPIYSVSEISQALKRTVENSFPMVRIRGEVSGLTRAASGHMYLTLKDDNAVIDGVCWRGTVGRLGMNPEDGLEVIVTGRLTTYPGRSRYQVVIDAMEVAGEGALLKLLEDRRKKLLAEGLFDEDRKRALPFLPEVIGVITSPTGAVIRDILHRLADRFPRHVLLWPVVVQGEGAAAQVAAAIEGFNRIQPGGRVPRPDLLIVARGGGSLEDLWAFNEEVVVRAAAASDIPLISAVGHETDTTLIDFAADLRAPTPTAAAELAVPVRSELLAQLGDSGARLVRATTRTLERRQTVLDGLARGIADPRRLLDDKIQRLDEWSERLLRAPRAGMERKQERLADALRRWRLELPRAVRDREAALRAVSRMLESLSYKGVLERGFALVTDGAGAPVTSAVAAPAAGHVDIRFHDGVVPAVVGTAPGKPKPDRPKRKKPPAESGGQGSLL